MTEQAVQVTDSLIAIAGHLFVHKDFSFTNKELLFDVFSKHYRGQQIKIKFWDGENLQFTNFLDFINYMSSVFNIPSETITIESHDPNTGNFAHIPMSLSIFWSTGPYLPENHSHEIAESKFVGSLLGRFNPTRLRLAYEIDQYWPNDSFVIFQPHIGQVQHDYRHLTELYSRELAWVTQKVFDRDLYSSHQSGTIDWIESTKTYSTICNNYQIEIISETDAVSNFWFTEKTARCLAMGKPFVLISGTRSLQRLRDLGFRTFGQVIDESYDNAATPTQRIQAALSSLNNLYTSPDKDKLITQLYQTADINKSIYKTRRTNS